MARDASSAVIPLGSVEVEPADRYRDLEPLAIGGMGEVFRARMKTDAGVEKRVALKLVREELAADPAFVEMFLKEAEVAIAMSHGNVVQTFDAGRIDGRPFLAMELVEGIDVGELVKRDRLAPEVALTIALEATKGLAYAHRLRGEDGKELGVVHRDVSPSNLLVSEQGEVKVADFGIARSARHRQGERGLRGKIAYMAPEQLRGLAIDARADVYGLGAVLYEMCAGRPPFVAEDLDALREAVLAGEVGMPSQHAEVAPEVDALVRRAMASDPGDRFASAEAFGEAIEETAHTLGLRLGTSVLRNLEATPAPSFDFDAALGDALAPAPRPATGTLEVPEAKAGRRWKGWALAAAMVAAFVGVGVVLDRPPPIERQRGEASVEPTQRGTDEEPQPEAPPTETAPTPPTVVDSPQPTTPMRADRRPAETRVTMMDSPLVEAEVTAEVTADMAADMAADMTAEMEGAAELWIASDPWAFVEIDGVRVGRTTLRGHRLSAGEHRVSLHNPEGDLRKTLVLRLAEGERRRISIDDWER